MPSSTIRRQMKNVVNNYSEAEKKVREATSNDPWGPSSSLMSEIADLTYNVVAFSEIMSMIWKRLNDHGKNWRHVYKALTLLDYLIKTGSERVALQCKENIFAIQTLKDFQYVDRDGKDQGVNVREKSKQLVSLLKDEERLKGERSQALKTKERMAQVATSVGSAGSMGFGRGSSQPNLSTSYSEEYGRSEGSPASYHGSTSPNASSELEQARPQTSGEEELQLQLALAMSREAAEQTPLHHRPLSTTDSSQPQTPVHHRPLSTTDSCPPQTPLHHRLLSTTDSCPPQTPLHHRPLSTTDPSPPQTPVHHRLLSTTDSCPPQTPPPQTPPPQTPLHHRPLHHRLLSSTDPSTPAGTSLQLGLPSLSLHELRQSRMERASSHSYPMSRVAKSPAPITALPHSSFSSSSSSSLAAA
ncbi:hypothetical protein ACEWY4_002523 [Coilia grayii]|uniref:ENTH domain-containing protein n=1 Tax=Coilia grayii TaxID=363190 RepID=A0ABD1KNK5_9TELE